MERLRRVDQLWSWLPAFRAVAETEHLRQAAEGLHVSASALSRTIGLVEGDVRAELFRRVGRRIALTDAGAVLLAATRDAMRLVHDALSQIESESLHGDVRIFAPSTVMRMYVVPALAALRSEHPGLRPNLTTSVGLDLGELLRRGELDVAFTNDPIVDPTLRSAALGRYTSGIYCGRTHPLRSAKRLELETLAEHPFVAPPRSARGHPVEGWPVELPREVAVEVSDLQVGIDICAEGSHLAVLPDRIVGGRVARGDLCRLPVELIPSTPFFGTHRPTLQRYGPAEAITDHVMALADAPT